MGLKKKGLEHELLFVIIIIIAIIIVIVSVWKYAGMSVASERMSELKINTVAQIKNILFLMQSAPVETTACASLKRCNKVEIHNTYIEIWGPANNYFKEGEYLSTSLAGNMDLYIYNETCDMKVHACISCCKKEGYDDLCCIDEGYGCRTCCIDKRYDCELWNILEKDESFVTPCGSGTSPVFVCFKKVDDKRIHIIGPKGG